LQERTLKTQISQLEKMHHETWLELRQETRKSDDAKKELQNLRSMLTIKEANYVKKMEQLKIATETN